jgi:hypothetical protein
MQTTLAILDQVSNTEGVSYQVFLQVTGLMFSSFLVVIFGLIVMHNTRFTSIDNRFNSIDQKLDKLVEYNGTRPLSDYKDELRIKSILKHLGIPDVTDLDVEDNSTNPTEE